MEYLLPQNDFRFESEIFRKLDQAKVLIFVQNFVYSSIQKKESDNVMELRM